MRSSAAIAAALLGLLALMAVQRSTSLPAAAAALVQMAPAVSEPAATRRPTAGSMDVQRLRKPQHVIMGFPMGRLCNRIDELLWGMHVAKTRKQPLLVWGAWLQLLRRDLDINVFREYMGPGGYRALDPDDPLIPYEDRDTWSMRTCAARQRMHELRGLVPAPRTRQAARQSLQALRDARAGLVACVLAPPRAAAAAQALTPRSPWPRGAGASTSAGLKACA